MAGEEEMRKSLNPRLVLEFVAVKMAWQEPLIPVDEILSRMEGIEKRLGQGAPAARARTGANLHASSRADGD